MERFQSFSKDAQCLLIRMINRRGAIFNRQHFRYPEISDIERALADLLACGQARGLLSEDYPSSSAFRKTSFWPAPGPLASAMFGHLGPSPNWLSISPASFRARTPLHCGADHFVAVNNTEAIEFLLYLYFGKTENDLKNCALRDLGIMRTNMVASFSARFTCGDEARACFHYSKILDRLEL
jgi:DNA polymerase-3 subunit epsilon